MENTSYYFYSTLSQAFAAITAIIYVAAQTRIKAVEDKSKSLKKNLLYRHYGDDHYNGFKVDNEMHKQTTQQVIISNLAKECDECRKMANELKSLVEHHSRLILIIKKFVLLGIGLTGIGLVAISVTPILIKLPKEVQYGLMTLLAVFSAYQLLIIKLFIESSFDSLV